MAFQAFLTLRTSSQQGSWLMCVTGEMTRRRILTIFRGKYSSDKREGFMSEKKKKKKKNFNMDEIQCNHLTAAHASNHASH